MNKFLAFIDELNSTKNDVYLYRLYFTDNKETLWGEYFNIVPSSIIPNLKPDMSLITFIATLEVPFELELAKNNSCFSMQDCIDGIISLSFYNDEENLLVFNFGETFEEIEEKILQKNFKLFNFKELNKEVNENEIINNCINKIKNEG